MDIRFYQRLLHDIRERRSVYSERLLSGSFEKLEDYKHIVGRLQGVQETETLIRILFKQTFGGELVLEEGEGNGIIL